MAKYAIHVVPADEGWVVRRGGEVAPVAAYPNKAAALAAGRELAKAEKVELVEHGRDGRIQDSDSFGNDPRAIKG
ncbi:DUF2188 domain-containing protein [Prosthecomicrobium sp. N25]|uniref:DUF2188 domain-containing protein n=1 Tax=Prosthecomicrobium sp. N25 TaxID=3129254 RepID=UPI003076DA37